MESFEVECEVECEVDCEVEWDAEDRGRYSEEARPVEALWSSWWFELDVERERREAMDRRRRGLAVLAEDGGC